VRRIQSIGSAALLHFLLLGALLHAAMTLWPQTPEAVVISAQEQSRLWRMWQQETARLPRPDEWQASLNRRRDEEVLLQEALRLGWAATDPVARRRLLQDWRFAHPHDQSAEPDQLRAAIAIGLPEHDEVVRRRLIQKMEQQLGAALALTTEEVLAYIDKHPKRYAATDGYRIEQHWLPDAHPEAARAAAQALQRGQEPAAGVAAWPYGEGLLQASAPELTRRFGAEFVAVLASLPLQQWRALPSPFGWHLVRRLPPNAQSTDAATPPLAQAAIALLEERRAEAAAAEITRLRQRHRVVFAAFTPP
jgi:hypothetical protein